MSLIERNMVAPEAGAVETPNGPPLEAPNQQLRQPRPNAPRRPHRGHRTAALILIPVFALVLGLGAALTATRAAAVFQMITETGKPGFLVLGVDSATPLWATLAPGDSIQWLIQASLHDADRSDLTVELAVRDAIPGAGGLLAEVRSCEGSYDLSSANPTCQGHEDIVLSESAVATLAPQAGPFVLAELHQDAPREFLVTLTLPANAPTQETDIQLARVGLGVHVSGEDPDKNIPNPLPQPSPVLAATGADALALALLAVGLIGVVGGALFWRRGAQ